MISDDRLDHFTIHPGELSWNPNYTCPWSQEKQDWIDRRADELHNEGKSWNTFDLSDEYDRLHAEGKA